MRLGLRSLLLCLLAWPAAASAAPATALPIIVYHQIRVSGTEPADSETAISLERFTEEMQYLHHQGYTTLGMKDVLAFLKGKSFKGKIVAVQFDDGWKSSAAALPVLERLKMKASFWIIAGAGHDEGSPHMDWPEVEALAKNPMFDVNSHTLTHPWKPGDTLVDWVEGKTPGKTAADAQFQLTESRRLLEAHLHRPVTFLAWPSGHYNDELIAMAHKAGYTALLTIDPGVNHPGIDPSHIRRTMIDGHCGLDAFSKTLSDGLVRDCG